MHLVLRVDGLLDPGLRRVRDALEESPEDLLVALARGRRDRERGVAIGRLGLRAERRHGAVETRHGGEVLPRRDRDRVRAVRDRALELAQAPIALLEEEPEPRDFARRELQLDALDRALEREGRVARQA